METAGSLLTRDPRVRAADFEVRDDLKLLGSIWLTVALEMQSLVKNLRARTVKRNSPINIQNISESGLTIGTLQH